MFNLVVRKETSRLSEVNRGKPVSTHYVKNIVCKASITGWLIFLVNCSQSSFFVGIFLFSVPKSIKGSIFHLRSIKDSKFVDQCYWTHYQCYCTHYQFYWTHYQCYWTHYVTSVQLTVSFSQACIKIWNCQAQYTELLISTLRVLQVWTAEFIILVSSSRIFIPYIQCGICKYKQNFHRNEQFRSKS